MLVLPVYVAHVQSNRHFIIMWNWAFFAVCTAFCSVSFCCNIGTKHSSHILFPNIELMLNNATTWCELKWIYVFFLLQKKVYHVHARLLIHSHPNEVWREFRTKRGNKQVSVISDSVIQMRWNCSKIRTNSHRSNWKWCKLFIFTAIQNRKFT